MKSFLKSLNILNVLGEVLARFPLPFMCATILTIVSYLELADLIMWDELYKRIFILCLTSFFSLTSFRLFSESRSLPQIRKILLPALILSLTYYIIFTQELGFVNLITYFLGILLTLTFAPFIFSRLEDKAQCNFNASLISNIFFTALSVIILFGGVSLILASLKYLLEVPIELKAYSYLWTFGALFFAPILFLSKLPNNFDNIEELRYPKGLSFNLEYLVAPLLVIYALVLYAYGVKILFEYDLPKGKVAYLVTAFGFIGIFAFSMLQPITEAKNIFVKLVRNYFYHIFTVPLALLIIGVWTRVSDYGITESRYILVLITFWFVITTAYIVFKKDASLKFINISLSALLILASFGPWRVTEVSASSQISRLETILVKADILVDGKINEVEKQSDITTDDERNIKSIARYIASNSHEGRIKNWFKDGQELPIRAEGKRNRWHNNSLVEKYILNRIGIYDLMNVPIKRNSEGHVVKKFNIHSKAIRVFNYFPNISEYDRVINLDNINLRGSKSYLLRLGSTEKEKALSEYKRPKFDVQITNEESEFVVDDATYKDSISINIREIVLRAHDEANKKDRTTLLKDHQMKLTKENNRFKISIFIYNASGTITSDDIKDRNVNFDNLSIVALLKDKKF